MGPPAALRLSGIVVRAGGQTILDVPSLEVAPGKILGLIGPNGAGKSTLLQVAALVRRPDAGTIEIGGEPVTRRETLRLRRRVAMVMQSPLLFDVGVLENAAV